MSMFTISISCLTTSNLPWFMDLTFQVPMQCCSLQHQTLLLSPVTSTTGCYFCFDSLTSFFLESFLHWSPVVYWAPTDWGSSSFSVLFFAFSFCSWGSHVLGPSSQGYGFSSGHVWMWELDCEERWAEELMLLNCGVGEGSWESLGLQGDPTSPS